MINKYNVVTTLSTAVASELKTLRLAVSVLLGHILKRFEMFLISVKAKSGTFLTLCPQSKGFIIHVHLSCNLGLPTFQYQSQVPIESEYPIPTLPWPYPLWLHNSSNAKEAGAPNNMNTWFPYFPPPLTATHHMPLPVECSSPPTQSCLKFPFRWARTAPLAGDSNPRIDRIPVASTRRPASVL